MKQKPISIAITTVPNDVFVFSGIISGKVQDLGTSIMYDDIHNLNNLAKNGEIDVIKISFSILGDVLDKYILLPIGSALTVEDGPLVVSKVPITEDCFPQKTLGIPGKTTTAYMLYKSFLPTFMNEVQLRFDSILPAIDRGEIDCGLLIHANRETLEGKGYYVVSDLTKKWMKIRGYSLPLGGLVARRDLGQEKIDALINTIKKSLDTAYSNREASENLCCDYFKCDRETVSKSLTSWVNADTINLSVAAEESIRQLLMLSEKADLQGKLVHRVTNEFP